MQAMCRFVKPILAMVPPDPTTLNPRELMKLVFLGRRFQDMPSEDKYNQVQLMTMSAADFLDQWFETDVLKATMSASGIIGTFLGVRSPGTAYVLLHHYMGEINGAFRSWGFARGGTGAISNSIAEAAKEAGAEIRTIEQRRRPSHILAREAFELVAKFRIAPVEITQQPWPTFDEILLTEDEVEIVVQINGKLRDRIKMPMAATEEELKTAALALPNIQERIAGKTVRNVIVVPKKLINIVV